ncbi:glycosyltransferase family 2 protein, partial [Macrococcoides caseolyticum]
MKKFKFSIIMPIYNVEKYLEEAILSVVNQTIGFEDNIQLVLVNDETPDNSVSIIKKYQSLYPENVVFVDKKNGGVSSARNAGIEAATGEYIQCLDPDDMLSENTLEAVYQFFDEKKAEIDLVAIPIKM